MILFSAMSSSPWECCSKNPLHWLLQQNRWWKSFKVIYIFRTEKLITFQCSFFHIFFQKLLHLRKTFWQPGESPRPQITWNSSSECTKFRWVKKIRKDIALNTHERNTHVHIFGSLILNFFRRRLAPRSWRPRPRTFSSKYGGPAERGLDDTFTIRFGKETSRSWVTKNANTMPRR